jgi:uracil-DNA glycosylase
LAAFDYMTSDFKSSIIGNQDPYHERVKLNGFIFSVDGVKIPPSLRNIFRELTMI